MLIEKRNNLLLKIGTGKNSKMFIYVETVSTKEKKSHKVANISYNSGSINISSPCNTASRYLLSNQDFHYLVNTAIKLLEKYKGCVSDIYNSLQKHQSDIEDGIIYTNDMYMGLKTLKDYLNYCDTSSDYASMAIPYEYAKGISDYIKMITRKASKVSKHESKR